MTMKSRNLMLRTRKLSGAEDHLTEWIAAALGSDLAFRQAYLDLVVGPFARANDWERPELELIDSQVSFKAERCRPDLTLTLRDGHVIGCEHKIDAVETTTISDDGSVRRRQLERYLERDLDGVAYFRASPTSVDEDVVKHPKYIRPEIRSHYLWRDLFGALSEGSHVVTQWLRETFEYDGHTPPDPRIGDLEHPDREERRRIRNKFDKFWDLTRARIATLQWKIESGSQCELQLKNHPTAPLHSISVMPGSSQLRIRYRASGDAMEWVEERARQIALGRPDVTVNRVLWNQGVAVEVRCRMDKIIQGDDPEQFGRDLSDFVVPFIEAVSADRFDASEKPAGCRA